MTKQANFYITHENFENLIGPGFWMINDLPPPRWEQIKDHFGEDETLAVFASGTAPTQADPCFGDAIGGIDWVRIESNRKTGEPPLNVYHYVIGPPDEHGYPVYGPVVNGSKAPHWSGLENLHVYSG